MKKVLLLVFTLFSFITNSQSITTAEYFFNTDPGLGNGTALTVNSNTGVLTQTFTIPTVGLSEGFNSVYVRVYNSDNNWSLYDRQNFYLKGTTSTNIAAAEYFFNTDPGVGNATTLSVDTNTGQLSQIFTISTTGLLEGFHSFYIRTQSTDGDWSLYDRQIIYIKDFDFTLDEVSAAEYFIDSDPGIGNGTSVIFGNPSQTSQILNINSTGLAEGDHIFYVRVQDTNGDWSIYDSALFTIDNSLGVENNLLSKIVLLPNPFENNLSIKSPNNIQVLKIEVYNTLGQTVYYSLEPKTTLELSTLKKGIYILNLKTSLGEASFKIIKK
ncbi:T9SS type A sorting domain-containing protein [Flavivirga sp. 57AJ16]|uniref:T9SS type A sorting domain-containing protein n=1 Tax=Flavivirga sp. 57AJ16 TaxID=3025307 RepID=UPI002365518C|nr:T9SS type A sorting domain-containing protein [Flavivirga sp. 57AJ16]MDD7887124.1 T9SS type A sorting domain-containing protein [Flavivirga sp. 57AJ16]